MVVKKFMQEIDSQRRVWIRAFIIILLRSCLKTVKRDRWSASQLREHSFLTSVMYGSLANGQQEVAKNNGKAGNDGPSHLVDQPEREELLPCVSFISGVPGQSRVECEFEKLQFLGRGGFGSVIKVHYVHWLKHVRASISCDEEIGFFFVISRALYSKILRPYEELSHRPYICDTQSTYC